MKFRNLPDEDYNCGGFALSMKGWIVPYDDTGELTGCMDDGTRDWFIEDRFDNGVSKEDLEAELLMEDVKVLTLKYPWLRQVDPNDYPAPYPLIAYRIFATRDDEWGDDTDFHFLRRIGHHWYQKSGTSNLNQCDELMADPSQPWVIDDAPDLVYTSPIVYFIDTRRTVYKNLTFS